MGSVLHHALFAAFACAIAGYFFVAGNSMPASAGRLPVLLSVLVFILSGAMMVKAVRSSRQNSEQEAPEAARPPLQVTRVAAYVALIVAYIYCIPRLGYFIATPLFMLLSYLYLRALGIGRSLLISVGFSLFIYLLFVRFLKLPIPMGLLEPFLG
ncbi:MAG TPA: hypothetical protein DIC53_04220 [Synergistaceae bacterium]|jgi:hypothetical protein|nr:hypothetical protein [Synergistaceae bacterium]